MELKKKFMIMIMVMSLIGSYVSAHDEGHGPKLSDTGKYGGLVSSVVLKSEAAKGAGATLVYKAELVRSSDGLARIYFYDSTMKPLDLKGFDVKAVASLGAKVKGKWKDVAFNLELKDGKFTGKIPTPEAKPFDIDVTLKKDGKELLSAFDNLD